MTFERYQRLAKPWTAQHGEASFAVHEPATGRLLANFRTHSADEVDRVVNNAHRAFVDGWREVPAGARATLMKKAARLLRDNADEIAEIESCEVGKPIEISRHYDMVVSAESFEYFGSLADKHGGQSFPGGPIVRVQLESSACLDRRGLVGVTGFPGVRGRAAASVV